MEHNTCEKRRIICSWKSNLIFPYSRIRKRTALINAARLSNLTWTIPSGDGYFTCHIYTSLNLTTITSYGLFESLSISFPVKAVTVAAYLIMQRLLDKREGIFI
jgi:hypothetical protein